MKKLLIILTMFCLTLSAQQTETGEIKLEIKNFGSNDGFVMIALFNNNEDYSNQGKPFKTAKLEIQNNVVNYIFEGLPFGEYAIKLFHDENNNEELDKGLFGIPTEDYAFSNNASGSFGPASYEDAKFELSKKSVTQKLEL